MAKLKPVRHSVGTVQSVCAWYSSNAQSTPMKYPPKDGGDNRPPPMESQESTKSSRILPPPNASMLNTAPYRRLATQLSSVSTRK